MSGTTEAFSRVKIDALRRDSGWDVTDGVSVRFEYSLTGRYTVRLRTLRPVRVPHGCA